MVTQTATRAAPGPGGATRESDATRYLCVGAQVDSEFAELVIQETLEERYRAVAPSWGFDLVPVVAHALSGRRRRVVRDTLLALLGVFNLLVNPVGTLVTVLSWLWIRFVHRAARQLLPRRHPRYAVWTAAVAYLVAVPFLLLIWLALLALTQPLASLAGWTTLGLGPVGALVFGLARRAVGAVMLLSVAFAWVVLIWERFSTRNVLVQTLRPRSRPSLPPVPFDQQVRDRLGVLLETQDDANITVYSGYLPFLGAGDHYRTWSFTIDLTRKATMATGLPPRSADPSVAELQAEIEQRLKQVIGSLTDVRRLSGLDISDHLFVSGGAIYHDGRFLRQPDLPPITRADPALVREVIENPTGAVRHFKCIRVESWRREIALSVFLHIAIQGSTLYVEQTACMLRPINAWYHEVDKLTKDLVPGEMASLLWRTLKDLPASLLRAPGALLRIWRSKRRQERQDRILQRMLAGDVSIDYGARVSVREAAAAVRWHNYFQELDVHEQLQMIELHVLETILGYLDRQGVDTGEFRRSTQATIVNSGIFMPGGTISGSAVASGAGATATGGGGTPAPTQGATGRDVQPGPSGGSSG